MKKRVKGGESPEGPRARGGGWLAWGGGGLGQHWGFLILFSSFRSGSFMCQPEHLQVRGSRSHDVYMNSKHGICPLMTSIDLKS